MVWPQSRVPERQNPPHRNLTRGADRDDPSPWSIVHVHQGVRDQEPDRDSNCIAQAPLPLERLLVGEDDRLSDAELLSLLIGSGRDAEVFRVAAVDLLDRFGTLRTLARASVRELTSVAGVGTAKAARVKSALTLATRMAQERRVARPRFLNSSDIYEHVQLDLRDLPQEVFEVLLLDAKNRLLRRTRISAGTLTGSLVHPREVFRPAVVEGAAAMVLLHNHPSGDPTPSSEDLEVTRRIVRAGEIIGIPILDHVIVGEGSYVSLAELGELQSPPRVGAKSP